jgi:4-amino-4-deoxy-L-arabinose transferase-like glycosyltransferase
MNRKYVILALILLIGAGLRSNFFFSNPQTNSDGVLYAWIGGNIADGYGFTIAEGTSLSDARTWHVPVYPIVLAVFYTVFGKGLLVSKLPAFVFGILTIILFYSFCKRLFDEQTALIASLFLAIHPQFVFFSSEVMAESIYTFFLLLFLYILLSQNRSKELLPYLLLGVTSGVCYLTRTVGILTLPVFALYTIYQNKKDFTHKWMTFTLGFLFIGLPWWLWSRSNYGTAFSAEQNTLIQMYQFEFGSFQGTHLSLFSYLFGHHNPSNIFMGFLDGISKLLKATFVPKILYFDETIGNRIFVYFSLCVIGAILMYGVYAQFKEEGVEITIVLLGTLIVGAFGYAWGAHVISAKSATLFRYTLSLTLILIIYLSIGIKHLFDKRVRYKILSLACVFLIVTSSLLINKSNDQFIRSWSDNFYSYAIVGLPKEAHVMGSNPEKLNELGFQNVHPIGRHNFTSLLKVIENKKIRYVIVDTSSIYNDDQFYMVNYWYRNRIPNNLKKIGSDLFPITIYEVS